MIAQDTLQRAREAFAKNVPEAQIRSLFGVSRGTFHRLVRKEGSRKKPGRRQADPGALKRFEAFMLKQREAKDGNVGIAGLYLSWRCVSKPSLKTVRRFLGEQGYMYRNRLERPYPSDGHKAERKLWAPCPTAVASIDCHSEALPRSQFAAALRSSLAVKKVVRKRCEKTDSVFRQKSSLPYNDGPKRHMMTVLGKGGQAGAIFYRLKGGGKRFNTATFVHILPKLRAELERQFPERVGKWLTVIADNDKVFFTDASSAKCKELKIKLATQPNRSPDLNVNDFYLHPAICAACRSTRPSSAAALDGRVRRCLASIDADEGARAWKSIAGRAKRCREADGGYLKKA
jgi:hypothetical protein